MVSTKKNLIQITYNMICDIGFTNITIRKISKEANCSIAALYRHFENFDHMLTYACIGFLEPYVEDYKLIKSYTNDPVKISIEMWLHLSRTSFFKPEIFAQLFLGPYKNNIYNIIKDYYIIFDRDIFNVGEVSALMEDMGDIFFRNYDYIKNSLPNKSKKEIQILSDLTVFNYCGILGSLLKNTYTVSEVEKMSDRFVDGLHYLYKDELSNDENNIY